MKNWKYINGAEVGNIDVSTSRLKDIEEQIKNWEHAINKVEGIDKEKAKKILEDLRKERAELRSQTGNETMHEWATSKPRNVGNAKYDIAFQGQIDGNSEQYYFVYDYQTDPGAHRPVKKFKTRDEARAYAKKLNEKDKVGNTKVINSDREFFKELADDAKEREDKDKQEVEKLVENRTVRTEEKNGWVAAYVNDHKIGHAKLVDVGSGWQAKGNIRLGIPGKLAISGSFFEFYKEKPSADRVAQDLLRDWENKWGSNAEAKAFIGNVKDKNGKELAEVSNSKVGNVASEYEILKHDPSKMHPMYKKAYEEAMKKLAREDEEFKKRFEKEYGVKAKNEASDDKFAYVMREFDEGKLKTPDGKVVTDPAQAKAIAYSESKKTENGLARARNAMVKNIATYKDFIKDLKNAIMLDVAGINYDSVDEQTLKTWVEQAKKDGYGSAIKGLQGKKVILDVY